MSAVLKVNEELKELIPPLSVEEFKQLESNILSDGIQDPIVIWNGVIVDGHNRYAIATKHGLKFATRSIEFTSLLDCKIWMVHNQFGRRNLPAYQRCNLVLLLEDIFIAKAKENQLRKPNSVPQISAELKVDTRKELAKLANVSHDTMAKVKVLKAKATPEVKAKLEEGTMSINEAYKVVKTEEKKENYETKKTEYKKRIETISVNELKVDIFNTKKKFRVIYADPAWSYNDKQDTPQLGGAAKHYSTMTVEEICKLPVNQISEKDSVLFLWVTSPLLEDAFTVIKRWGFKYKTSFVWDKVKHNMGHYNSVRHEFLLIATKGSCTPDNKTLYNSVQTIERNDNHSEKPIEFLNIIDNLYNYGDKLEMFCRHIKKEKWYGWGNEI